MLPCRPRGPHHHRPIARRQQMTRASCIQSWNRHVMVLLGGGGATASRRSTGHRSGRWAGVSVPASGTPARLSKSAAAGRKLDIVLACLTCLETWLVTLDHIVEQTASRMAPLTVGPRDSMNGHDTNITAPYTQSGTMGHSYSKKGAPTRGLAAVMGFCLLG